MIRIINILHKFLLIISIFFINNLFGQDIKKGNASIVKVYREIGTSNNFFCLYYIVINNKIYAGDGIENFILGCEYFANYVDTVKVKNYNPEDRSALIRKFPNKIKNFKTKLACFDSFFYWSAISVPMEYFELPCQSKQGDFFDFVYNEPNNLLYIRSVDLQKIKVGHFPKFFLDKIIENTKCP